MMTIRLVTPLLHIHELRRSRIVSVIEPLESAIVLEFPQGRAQKIQKIFLPIGRV